MPCRICQTWLGLKALRYDSLSGGYILASPTWAPRSDNWGGYTMRDFYFVLARLFAVLAWLLAQWIWGPPFKPPRLDE